jgi:uncharacterized protein with von Willebrand factor type A (vWA) domain
MFESLMALPGTDGLAELRTRADALAQWKVALQKGALPRAEAVAWPREPFRSKFIAALSSLEMARFTRRYPAVLDTLLKQMLSLVHDFETKLLEAEAKRAREGKKTKPPSRPPQQQSQQSQQSQQKPPPKKDPEDGDKDEQSASQDGEGSRQDPEGDDEEQSDQDMVQASGQGQGDAGGGGGGGGAAEPGGEQDEDQDEGGELTQEQLEQAMREAAEAARAGEQQQGQGQHQGREVRLSLESSDGAAQEAAEAAARDVVDAFERKMQRVVERLEAAQAALGDLSDVLDAAGEGGEGGFDLSKGVWTRAAGGWRELDELRRKLESLRELRDLVRSLGRAGGKGPMRRAPEQLEGSPLRDPDGVVRSPLQPEEVRGLSRSGELSRMLPSEMALLAHGWPRKRQAGGGLAAQQEASEEEEEEEEKEEEEEGGSGKKRARGAAAAPPADDAAWIQARERKQRARDDARRARAATSLQTSQTTLLAPLRADSFNNPNPNPLASGSETEQEEEYFLPGAHAARMLHRVRRAERALLSYERLGWLDSVPARPTGRTEVRPAAELGPIILCLDTSGSMRGAREVVAKALALECLRGAHRQRRRCYLYAFSGPEQVQELELGVDAASLARLLDFLAGSFNGGTDVDAPLQKSLERLERDPEWRQADVLMVTDGEVAPPSEELLGKLGRAKAELGLEVHGLVVSSQKSEAMEALCTRVHTFKSWSAVGAESWQY